MLCLGQMTIHMIMHTLGIHIYTYLRETKRPQDCAKIGSLGRHIGLAQTLGQFGVAPWQYRVGANIGAVWGGTVAV